MTMSNEDLDARMIAAGMIPLSSMLKGHGEMEKWMRHAHVHTFEDFVEYVNMKQREYMSMRMRYELGDKDKNDDMFEWIFAHASAYDAIATQLRGILPYVNDLLYEQVALQDRVKALEDELAKNKSGH